MPKVVVDSVSTSPAKLQPPQARRSPAGGGASETSDSGQTFEQALKDASPKPAKAEDAQPSAVAAKPQKAQADQKAPADEQDAPPDATAQQGSAPEADPAAAQFAQNVDLPPLSDEAVSEKPPKKDDEGDADQTPDAILAAAQAAVAVAANKQTLTPPQQTTPPNSDPALPKASDPAKAKTGSVIEQIATPAAQDSGPTDDVAVKAIEAQPLQQKNPKATQAVEQVVKKLAKTDQPEAADENTEAPSPKVPADSSRAAEEQLPKTANQAPSAPTPQQPQRANDVGDDPAIAIKPRATAKLAKTESEDAPTSLDAGQFALPTADSDAPTPSAKQAASSDPKVELPDVTQLVKPDVQTLAKPQNAAPAAPTPPPTSEADFAGANHDRIVSSVRSELIPNGGTMHIRLDPPELGALQVTVRMIDGAMTASFETSTDQATKLLSHSLGQLKTALETQGVSVERLHVQQSPRDQQSSSNSDDRRQSRQEDASARQEQQRREMLRRMWRRLGMIHDPLDMVA
jgi:flagellar hook-length control protein FliK